MAFSCLTSADREAPLEPEDLVLGAQAALLTGRMEEGPELLARAHQGFLARGDAQPAARCAFWLGFNSLVNGEFAKAGGWLSRASRLLEGCPDCVESGYLLMAEGYRAFHEGNVAAALESFLQAVATGERFGDKDLATLALQGQGRVLIRQGEIARGTALLDEAMVAVTAGEVSPLNAGGVYCSVLEACGEMCDIERAREWTSELEKWCASQPDLVPFRGHCLIRRSELLGLRGAWEEALEWARRAVEWVSQRAPRAAVGHAWYQVGEIRRLRSEFAESDDAYTQASQWSRCPGPGPALLRLAQGRVDAAMTAIRGMADEALAPGPRAIVLDAYVEIAIAADDAASARGAAAELAEIATRRSVPFLRALSARASGAVLLAEGDARGAVSGLRQSLDLWRELEAPYEAARARASIGLALRRLGDEESAAAELNASRQAFERLGAAADLARVDTLLERRERPAAGPLTGREVEVLRLVASGKSNREIAGSLRISEKTVARHLSNIFTKLDLPSRTAAAAYAYDNDLV